MEPFPAEPGVCAVRGRGDTLPRQGCRRRRNHGGSRVTRVESRGDDGRRVYKSHRAYQPGEPERGEERRPRSRGSTALVADRVTRDAGGTGRGGNYRQTCHLRGLLVEVRKSENRT